MDQQTKQNAADMVAAYREWQRDRVSEADAAHRRAHQDIRDDLLQSMAEVERARADMVVLPVEDYRRLPAPEPRFDPFTRDSKAEFYAATGLRYD